MAAAQAPAAERTQTRSCLAGNGFCLSACPRSTLLRVPIAQCLDGGPHTYNGGRREFLGGCCCHHSFGSPCHLPSSNNKQATMADEEDYAIESTDAGASATIPMEAGQIKKGGYVLQMTRVTARVGSWRSSLRSQCLVGVLLSRWIDRSIDRQMDRSVTNSTHPSIQSIDRHANVSSVLRRRMPDSLHDHTYPHIHTHTNSPPPDT